MPLTFIRHDITKMHVDAIVNAANTDLQMGGGVCGAIFRAAGALQLQAACDPLAPIRTGEAVITPGFQLPARHIIHTVGPVYQDGRQGEEILLRSCYLNALKLAVEHGCESMAFPLIASGIYGYPKEDALQVAIQAIRSFLADHDLDVSLVVFDQDSFAISQKRLGEVKAYIDENYVGDYDEPLRRQQRLPPEAEALRMQAAFIQEQATVKESHSQEIEDLLHNLDAPFSQVLLSLIDAKGKTDVEVYKRANLDRKLFSKIRSNKAYMPGKRTALALAIALELSLEETADLLKRAGYGLSPSHKFDVIIEYFIASGQYDLDRINEILFIYDQPLLGG